MLTLATDTGTCTIRPALLLLQPQRKAKLLQASPWGGEVL